MIVVVIKKLPIASFSYFQWFLLGLYLLQQKKKIKLKFRIAPLNYLVLMLFNNKYLAGGLRRLFNVCFKYPNYNLVGYVKEGDKKRSFTIDSKDSPFIFNDSLLEKMDVYYKIQCPKEIEESGFPLNNKIRVPYSDIKYNSSKEETNLKRKQSKNVFIYRNKIKPAMVGPRRLAWSCRFKDMYKTYCEYLKSQSVERTKKVMCYFGNNIGPDPSAEKRQYDLDLEWDNMRLYADFVEHPNIKRYKASQIISKDIQNDARVINIKTDSGETIVNKNKIIPLTAFCDHVAHFQYNFNISGFRLSIPNRFIESFIGGTAILTDKLYVKWYLPFDSEVVETVDMGYYKDNDVDWEQFKRDLSRLPQTSKNEIIELYKRKWAPEVFATYIINNTLNM